MNRLAWLLGSVSLAVASGSPAAQGDVPPVISVEEIARGSRVELRQSVVEESIDEDGAGPLRPDVRILNFDSVILRTRHGDERLLARRLAAEEVRKDRGASRIPLLAPSAVKGEVLWLHVFSRMTSSSDLIRVFGMPLPLARRAPASEWFPYDIDLHTWQVNFPTREHRHPPATSASAWLEEGATVVRIHAGESVLGELIIDPVARTAVERSGLPVNAYWADEVTLSEAEIQRGLELCRGPIPREEAPPGQDLSAPPRSAK